MTVGADGNYVVVTTVSLPCVDLGTAANRAVLLTDGSLVVEYQAALVAGECAGVETFIEFTFEMRVPIRPTSVDVRFPTS